MYSALWRILPGPIGLRILILFMLAAGILYAIIGWVFPWIDNLLVPVEDVTVN
jgi:dolichol kinase